MPGAGRHSGPHFLLALHPPHRYHAPISNAPDSPLPILGTRIQNAILRDFHTVLTSTIAAAHEYLFAGLDLGDTVSWAHKQITDELGDKFSLSDNEANSLTDFLALVYKHLENPEDSHSEDVTETTLAPATSVPVTTPS